MIAEAYVHLARACLGWGHFFLRLSNWLIEQGQRNA